MQKKLHMKVGNIPRKCQLSSCTGKMVAYQGPGSMGSAQPTGSISFPNARITDDWHHLRNIRDCTEQAGGECQRFRQSAGGLFDGHPEEWEVSLLIFNDSLIVKEGIPSSQRYLPTYLPVVVLLFVVVDVVALVAAVFAVVVVVVKVIVAVVGVVVGIIVAALSGVWHLWLCQFDPFLYLLLQSWLLLLQSWLVLLLP